jgi:hypothetical protein
LLQSVVEFDGLRQIKEERIVDMQGYMPVNKQRVDRKICTHNKKTPIEIGACIKEVTIV